MTIDHGLIEQAIEMIRESPDYLADARRHAGNSIVGSLLSLTRGSPRWATEAAVAEAVRRLSRRRRRSRED